MMGNAARAKLRERAKATKQKTHQKPESVTTAATAATAATASAVGDGGDEGKKEASPVKGKNCAQCFFCRWEAAHGPIFSDETDKEKKGGKDEEEEEEEERSAAVDRI